MLHSKVSVLMSVFNAERYLTTSIESILNQSFTDIEFIIVEDCSTDKSWKLIQKYAKKDKRIIAIRNEAHIGTTKSLNKGLSLMRGEYVVRMDADDFSYPNRIKIQYDFMEANPNIGVSGGYISVCDSKLKVVYKREYSLNDIDIRNIIYLYSPFAHPSTIWRSNLIKKMGGYNQNIPLSQDCELYFKIGSVSKFGNVDKLLIKLRMHKNSSSYSKDRLQEIYAIYSRIKSILEFNYNPRPIDKLYIVIRILSLLLVPTQLKFYLFNLVRRKI